MSFIPCRNCSKGDFPGYIHKEVSHHGVTYSTLEKCACFRDYLRKQHILLQVNRSNLRPSLVEMEPPYHPDTHYKGTKSLEAAKRLGAYVRKVSEGDPIFKRQSLYMHGPYNTQKTTMAQWAGIALLESRISVQYTLMRTLVNSLVEQQFDSDKEQGDSKNLRREYLRKVKECDVLILDESFDLSKMTIYKSQYQIPFLDEFVRDRLDVKEKPIIFVSNVQVESIDPIFASLKNLLRRRISKVGAALLFEDDYDVVSNSFETKDIFA